MEAGVRAAMKEGDWTFATYRGHAHTLARGVPMTPVMAERSHVARRMARKSAVASP